MAKRPSTKPRISAGRRRLATILAERNVDRWDYCLFGDGSGSHKMKPYGWACVVVERATAERTVFYGSGNHGSSIYAELAAFTQPIGWVIDRVVEERKISQTVGGVYVHAFSDNEFTCKYMNDECDGPQSFRVLRGAKRVAEAHGIIVRWHHLDRETESLNAYVDRVSRAARVIAQPLDPDKEAGIISVDWASP